MEKKFIFKINNEYYKKLFLPVRNKYHIIEILMHSIKYIYLYSDDFNMSSDNQEKMILYISKKSKISRLFFIEEKRIFSINFPFKLLIEDSKLKSIYSDLIGDITVKLTSDTLSLINCNKGNCSFEFFDPIMNYQENENENIWEFIKDILIYEDAYIRYDHDEENFNIYKNKGEEKKHPLHHLDIFYSTGTTFKLLNFRT